jgi:hypothetical protein
VLEGFQKKNNFFPKKIFYTILYLRSYLRSVTYNFSKAKLIMNLNTSKIQAREEKKGLKKTQKKVFNVRSKAFFIELLGIG